MGTSDRDRLIQKNREVIMTISIDVGASASEAVSRIPKSISVEFPGFLGTGYKLPFEICVHNREFKVKRVWGVRGTCLIGRAEDTRAGGRVIVKIRLHPLLVVLYGLPSAFALILFIAAIYANWAPALLGNSQAFFTICIFTSMIGFCIILDTCIYKYFRREAKIILKQLFPKKHE
jgi:hypothetical protein